jgi:mannose-1-phosphate guanylyltransferase
MNKIFNTPWGQYTIIQEWSRHKLKGLLLKAGECTSLQIHKLRRETWHIVKGRGTVIVGTEVREVEEGDVVEVPKDTPHRIIASDDEGLVIFEVQEGICKEADIVRLEDKYGRSNN